MWNRFFAQLKINLQYSDAQHANEIERSRHVNNYKRHYHGSTSAKHSVQSEHPTESKPIAQFNQGHRADQSAECQCRKEPALLGECEESVAVGIRFFILILKNF